MAGSALKVLNMVKEQLKACEEAFVEARQLNKQIQGFEVTILMIPARAKTEEEPIEEEEKPENGGAATVKDKAKEYAKEAANFAVSQVKDRVMDAVMQSPAGALLQIFNTGKGIENIFDEKEPGKKLEAMKNALDENKMRIYSDLEVMFMGMAFIVGAALSSIREAVSVLKKMMAVGPPNCMWSVMPWKVQELLGLKEELAGHRENLAKQVVQLQTAIGVASYAVQLEQLER